MVDFSLVDKIKGLKELFKIVPDDYNFHDDELERVQWDMMKCELIVTYSMHDYAPTRVWYVTWHIKPAMDDFQVNIAPHNSYTYGIDITPSELDIAKYRFFADGAGPIVECEDIWVEVEETDPEKFFDEE